jgi:hypothetical protein
MVERDTSRNVTREELRNNPKGVMQKARSLGTVVIVDEQGKPRATLSIITDEEN